MKISNHIPYRTLTLSLGMLAACAAPPSPVPAPNIDELNTIVAETAIRAQTQSAVPGTSSLLGFPIDTGTPTSTFTPGPPTQTQTTTLTPTPIFTFTPPIPIISVSVSTNCRSGPGKAYIYKGALLAGQVAEVLALDPTGKYFYIQNPESPGNFCWVWGQYATIAGNSLNLPIYTPPPTPTPSFTPLPTFTPTLAPDIQVSYTSMDSCAGWWVEFKLINTGDINLRSVEITAFDSDTHVTLSNLTDGFTDINGCLTSTTTNVLMPELSVIVSAPAFVYNPSGHEIELTVKVCSKTGQSGLCIKKKIEFVP